MCGGYGSIYDDRERSKVPEVTFRSGALDVERGGG